MGTPLYDVNVGFRDSDGEVMPGIAFSVAGDNAGDAMQKALMIVAARLSLVVTERNAEQDKVVSGAEIAEIRRIEEKELAARRARVARDEPLMRDNISMTGCLGPRKFWLSCYAEEEFGRFDLMCPWWQRDDHQGKKTLCAAVKATNADEAKAIVRRAFETVPTLLKFKFADEMPDGWHPFNKRFPREPWMIWNEKVTERP